MYEGRYQTYSLIGSECLLNGAIQGLDVKTGDFANIHLRAVEDIESLSPTERHQFYM